MQDDGSSAFLIQLIQITILVVGILAAFKFVSSSKAMTGQLANATQGFAKKFGVEKGLNAGRKGLGGAVKERALNTEARMDNSNNRFGRAVGGYRTRRKKTQANRESVREQMHEEAYYGGLASGTPAEQEARRARAMGIGGNSQIVTDAADRLGRQAGGYADAKRKEREREELKQADLTLEAQIIPGDVDELRRRLRASLNSGDAIGTKALMARLAQEGKSAVAGMGDDIQAAATSGVFDNDQDMHRAVAEQRQTDWTTIKGADPTLAGLNLTSSATAAAGTSSPPVTAESLASMAPKRIQQLASQGAIDDEMIGQAGASGVLGKMDPGQRAALDSGLQGAHLNNPAATGTAPTAQEISTEHQARAVEEGVRRGMSDYRLKKNVVRLGVKNNVPLYKFEYLWSSQQYVGTMAQDIINSHPDAVSVSKDGFYRVDYGQLGFAMTTYEEWKSKKG